MITLTGKETKAELQILLKGEGIKFSQLDTKEKLLQLVEYFNNEGEEISLSKVSDTNEILSQSEKKEFLNDLKQITGSQYCNIKGHNKRTKFFIEKKYNQEYFSMQEWDEIFIKERLV